jgi:hypothetical protein
MKLPRTSQLQISDRRGRRIGDNLCGPLAFYAFFRARGRERMSFSRFLERRFPRLRIGEPLTLECAVEQLSESGALENLPALRIRNLARERAGSALCRQTHRLLTSALKRGPVLAQIGAYHASVSKGRNKWRRDLGHFVVILSAGPAPRAEDPLFTMTHWDPWDGRVHTSVLYEELYRDFSAMDFGQEVKNNALRTRLSPSGHRVLSPYPCVLAPHLDLYDPKVYFAQRYIYALERVLTSMES